jgi:hypothetical protein
MIRKIKFIHAKCISFDVQYDVHMAATEPESDGCDKTDWAFFMPYINQAR